MTKPVKDIQCEQAIKMLFEYIDNELGEHNHAVMENHLHTCRSCFSRMEFEKRLKNMVTDAKEETAPDDLRNRVKKITSLF